LVCHEIQSAIQIITVAIRAIMIRADESFFFCRGRDEITADMVAMMNNLKRAQYITGFKPDSSKNP
jgi:hypothetical protein